MGDEGVELFGLESEGLLPGESVRAGTVVRIVAADGTIGERRSVGRDMVSRWGDGAAMVGIFVSMASLGSTSIGPEWSVITTRMKSPGRAAIDVEIVESMRV
jgi:hypothetical protein